MESYAVRDRLGLAACDSGWIMMVRGSLGCLGRCDEACVQMHFPSDICYVFLDCLSLTLPSDTALLAAS